MVGAWEGDGGGVSDCVIYKCRRCAQLISEGPHENVQTALRRALEHSPTITHECPVAWGTGGGFGIADLIGTSERPKQESAA
jgi:hypothetical protein